MATRFDPTELARFGGLALRARQVVEGFLTGVHRSPFKGASVEFAEHRQYSPGDEIRRIDWRTLGKTDKYFVKEYEDETNLRATLVVDASQSMAYRGGNTFSKFEYAQQVAASLAYLLLSQLDAVGLITHDAKLRERVPSKSTAKQLLEILQVLQATATGGETSLGGVWETIAARYLKRRGLIVLISDCFDAIAPMQRALRLMRFQHHEVILFQIVAVEEIEFPFKKATKFRGMEASKPEWTVDAKRIRDEYLRKFRDHENALRRIAAECGIDFRILRTDQPVERALGAYITGRKV